jgi:hypothetical protein
MSWAAVAARAAESIPAFESVETAFLSRQIYLAYPRRNLLDAVSQIDELGAKILTFSEAKTLVQDYRALVPLVAEADRIFRSSPSAYMSPGQWANAQKSATLWAREQGTAMDKIFKELVGAEQNQGRFLNYGMTKQGASGVDLFWGNGKIALDLTTAQRWGTGNYLYKYGANHKIVLPLFYR